MNVLVLQVFVGALSVVGAVAALRLERAQRDHEHADRLALFPARGRRPGPPRDRHARRDEDATPDEPADDHRAPSSASSTTTAPCSVHAASVVWGIVGMLVGVLVAAAARLLAGQLRHA